MPCAPKEFHEELLSTSAEDVPREIGDAVASICAKHSEVRAAYVCRVRREEEAAPSSTVLLSTAIEPVLPLGEDDRAPRSVNYEILTSLPEALRDGGLSWLAPLAIPTWREYGITVYQRL